MAQSTRAIAAGDDAPNFELPDGRGLPWNLSGQLEASPVMLVFYRGAWCPYANGQLALLARRHGDFERRGAQVVGISTDPPRQNLELRNELLIPFTVLSDAYGGVASEYGLWDEDEGTCVPAVVLVDRSGTVGYVHRGLDVADHPAGEDLLDALRALPRTEKAGMRGPEVRLSAAEARERTVRRDLPPVALDTLPAFFEGALLSTRTLAARLRAGGWFGGRAAREADRHARILESYRDAVRATRERVEGS